MSMDDRIPVVLSGDDSPFIPSTGIQFAWDSVSLTSALACWRRYQYMILEGLTPKSRAEAVALSFGIAFHYGLERYQKLRFSGASHDDALHNALQDVMESEHAQDLPTDEAIDEQQAAHDPDEDDGISLRNGKVRTRYYLARALVWYMEHYAVDNLRTLALPSGKPAVEVSFRLPTPLTVAGQPLTIVGHIDRVVDFNDTLYVMDHKTSKGFTSSWRESFDLSHQMTGYTVAGTSLFDRPVKGAWIDGVALQVGSVKFSRHLTNRTAGQIGEYFSTLRDTAQRAEQLWDELGVEGKDYPMNTSACFLCHFKEVCRKPPEVRTSYINQLYNRGKGWNPLRNR